MTRLPRDLEWVRGRSGLREGVSLSASAVGRTTLTAEDAAQLQLAASMGVRVVVSVYGQLRTSRS